MAESLSAVARIMKAYLLYWLVPFLVVLLICALLVALTWLPSVGRFRYVL
jgi:hypothetical protein